VARSGRCVGNLPTASPRLRVVQPDESPARVTDFDTFVGNRYPTLVRFGYVLTGNRSSAEDLVQTALFSTYRRWDRLEDNADPYAYVRRAMVNAHISWTRLLSSREQLFPNRRNDQAPTTMMKSSAYKCGAIS